MIGSEERIELEGQVKWRGSTHQKHAEHEPRHKLVEAKWRGKQSPPTRLQPYLYLAKSLTRSMDTGKKLHIEKANKNANAPKMKTNGWSNIEKWKC
ncbi:hypothetical protein V6N13_098501 [Hibiscus sabdariffa]